jgi:hypothetical protein
MNEPAKTIAETRTLAETQESLVNRVTDAQKALEISARAYKKSWEEWRQIADSMLPEMRTWRMAVNEEVSKSLASFADVRSFFLSDKHDMEIIRLREFVDLMERFQALQASGFLDKVTDVMLKMEERI